MADFVNATRPGVLALAHFEVKSEAKLHEQLRADEEFNLYF